MVHDGESRERERHAEEIEEKRRDVLKRVFDEDERTAPDEDDCQEQDMCECAGAKAFGQLLLCSCGERRIGVDGFAVDYGAKDFGVKELLRRCGRDVAVEDDEVSEKSWLETAFHFFAELAEGGGLGVGVDRFVERELFLGLEGLGTGFVLAGDRRVEATEGVDEFDGVVGAEGEDDVVVEEALPGVGVLDAFGAEAIGGPLHVGEEVRGLH